MANRRMFSRDILQGDDFIELSTEARLLYVYLNLNADDDGFVDNPRGIARLSGCKYSSIEELKQAGFVLEFENRVFVVTHWMVHNYIPKDRYKATRFIDEKTKLSVNARKEYTRVSNPYTECIHDVYGLETQERIGEDREGKDRLGKVREGEEGEENSPAPPKTVEEVENYCKENALSVDARHFFRHFEASGWVDSKGHRVTNWRQKLLEWEKYETKGRKKKGHVPGCEDFVEADRNQKYPWAQKE